MQWKHKEAINFLGSRQLAGTQTKSLQKFCNFYKSTPSSNCKCPYFVDYLKKNITSVPQQTYEIYTHTHTISKSVTNCPNLFNSSNFWHINQVYQITLKIPIFWCVCFFKEHVCLFSPLFPSCYCPSVIFVYACSSSCQLNLIARRNMANLTVTQ